MHSLKPPIDASRKERSCLADQCGSSQWLGKLRSMDKVAFVAGHSPLALVPSRVIEFRHLNRKTLLFEELHFNLQTIEWTLEIIIIYRGICTV